MATNDPQRAAPEPPPPSAVRAEDHRFSRLSQSVQFALWAIVIAVAVSLVYARSIHAPFIFDDTSTIVGNRSITRLWPLVGNAADPAPLTPPAGIATSARPLVNLTLAANYYFGELHPAGYRATNIVLHIAVAILLAAIIRRTLLLDYFRGRFERVATPLSFAVAIAWALHPLVTESVAYVTQRSELLMALFYLAVLYASLRYWAAARPATRGAWIGLASLACLLGMFSKEVMVTAPLVVWLFERTFVAGSFRRALGTSWPLYLGLAAGCIAWAAYAATGPRTPAAGFLLGIDAQTWWLTQCQVLWMYLKLAVWPWPLVIHYDLPLVESARAGWPWLAATALLVLAILALVWRRTSAGFVLASVLVVLSPTLIVPLVTEVAAERRMYLPLAALVAFAVIALYRLAQWIAGWFLPGIASRGQRIPLGITMSCALALAVVFGLVSTRRLAAYDSELTLWSEAFALQPHNVTAEVNVGNLLARAGRRREAIEHFEHALKLCPESMRAHYDLACALEESGQTRRAMHHFREAIRCQSHPVNRWQRFDEGVAAAHTNLGRLLSLEGKYEQAIAQFREALGVRPDFAPAHNNLGIALVSLGQAPEAIVHFEQALRSNRSIEGYTNLATAYAQVGRTDDAMAAAAQAVELARAQGQAALADQIETHLRAYREEATRP